MRESGRLLATVLATLREAVQPGMSTKELAEIAKRELRGTGGTPTILGMYGFPDVICISLNDEVVHGIPSSKRIIKEGDLISLDFCVTYDGMITDAATSVVAGQAAPKVARLLRDTEAALYAGIQSLHDGVRVGDVAHAIETELKKGK